MKVPPSSILLPDLALVQKAIASADASASRAVSPEQQAVIEEAERLLKDITDGPWQVIEDKYEPSEKFGALAGTVAQRRIFTTWDHPQLKGPVGVVNGYTTIAKVCGQQPHHGVSIGEADAAFIAAAPRIVRKLLAALSPQEPR